MSTREQRRAKSTSAKTERKRERRQRRLAKRISKVVAASHELRSPQRTALPVPDSWRDLVCPECGGALWGGVSPADGVSMAHAAPPCAGFMALVPSTPEALAFLARALKRNEQVAPNELHGHCHACSGGVRVQRGTDGQTSSISHAIPSCEVFLNLRSAANVVEFLTRSFGGQWTMYKVPPRPSKVDEIAGTCFCCNQAISVQMDEAGRPSVQHDMPLCAAMSSIRTPSDAVAYINQCCARSPWHIPAQREASPLDPPITSPGGSA